MGKKKKSSWEALKNFYRLYTSGLGRDEIERLLKRESKDVLAYYKRKALLDDDATMVVVKVKNQNNPKYENLLKLKWKKCL